MTKRVLGCFLTVALIINMFVVAFSATAVESEADYKGRFLLSCDSDLPKQGDTITVTLSVQNNYPVSVIGSVIGYDSNYYEIVGDNSNAITILGDWPVSLITVAQNPEGMYHPSYTDEMRAQYSQLYVSLSWLSTLAEEDDTSTDMFKTVTPIYSFQLKVKDNAPEDGNGLIWMDPVYQRVENMWADARNSSKITRGGNDLRDGELEAYGQTISFECAKLFGGEINYDCLHINTEWRTVLDATCTSDGLEQLYCLDCNEFIDATERILPATGHEYEAVVTPPTCTEQGYTTYTCKNCGDEYIVDYTDPVGHTWGKWEVTTQATCTQDGVETRMCTVSGCGATETRAIPATGHEYEAFITSPTCTKQGYTTYICKNCSDTYVTDYKDPIGHVWSNWIITRKATCTQDGEEMRSCAIKSCGATETRAIPAIGHEYEAIVTPPTCTEQGFTTYTCKNCGDTYITDYTNPIGHTWGDWIVTTEAKCTQDGIETRTCTVSGCGATETRAIPAIGHEYETVVTPPTCTEQGYTTYTCKNCGDTYITDYTNPIGHTWGDWIVTTEAKCTQDGIETRTCTVSGCGATETRAISAIGHEYEAIVTPPTCTEQGYTTYTCKNCGDTYTADYTDPIGHTWGDWIVTTPATVTTEGVETRKCSLCKQTETRVIPVIDVDSLLAVANGSSCIIDNDKHYIYNYNSMLDLQNQLTLANTNYALNILSTANGYGTGAKILVMDGNNVIAEYTIAIFGDLNGDGVVDAFDSTLMTSYTNFESIPEGGYDSVYAFVSDVNHDGTIDSFDETIIRATVNFELVL